MALLRAPILFAKRRKALADPYPPLSIPKCAQSETSDYEAELCVVIGKSGRNLPKGERARLRIGLYRFQRRLCPNVIVDDVSMVIFRET